MFDSLRHDERERDRNQGEDIGKNLPGAERASATGGAACECGTSDLIDRGPEGSGDMSSDSFCLAPQIANNGTLGIWHLYAAQGVRERRCSFGEGRGHGCSYQATCKNIAIGTTRSAHASIFLCRYNALASWAHVGTGCN